MNKSSHIPSQNEKTIKNQSKEEYGEDTLF